MGRSRGDPESTAGNRLEKLKGKLEGSWSLRINDQWLIIFRWVEGEALDVDIVDYH